MKTAVQPKYFPEARVTCSCGNTFTTGSVRETITVEVCHKCHPFYTGEERLLDTKGRAEDFSRRMKTAEKYRQTVKGKKQGKTGKKSDNRPKTLRELLGDM